MGLQDADRVPQGRPDDVEEIRGAGQIPSRLTPRRRMHEGANQCFGSSEFAADQVIREPFERDQEALAPVPNVRSLQDDNRWLEDLESGIEVAFAVADHRRCWSTAGRAEAVGRTEEPVEDRTTVEDVSGSVSKFDEFRRVIAGRRQLKDRLQREHRSPEVWIAPFVSAIRDRPSVQPALVVYRSVPLPHVGPGASP